MGFDAPGRVESRKADADAKTDSAGGISRFLGKVLEQLSLSSWLPSAMLVGNFAILLQLLSMHQIDVGAAVLALTRKPLGILIVLLFALVLGAIVTQAFEFEVIRLLEGYVDTPIPPVRSFVKMRIRRHQGRREKIEKRLLEKSLASFGEAKTAILESVPKPGKIRPALDIIDDDLNGRQVSKKRRRRHGELAANYDWMFFVPAGTDYALSALDARLRAYPAAGRVLPTRLGNVLRAAEDRIELGDGENLEGFVIRNHSVFTETLLEEHKDYRTRLDMYCSLTLTFVVLSAAAAVTMSMNSGATAWQACIPAVSYFILAGVSYEAAIASGRGYGQVLAEMDQAVRKVRRDAVVVNSGPGTSSKDVIAPCQAKP